MQARQARDELRSAPVTIQASGRSGITMLRRGISRAIKNTHDRDTRLSPALLGGTYLALKRRPERIREVDLGPPA
jgi:hypothetical protein